MRNCLWPVAWNLGLLVVTLKVMQHHGKRVYLKSNSTAQVVIGFIEIGTENAPIMGVFYTKMKLSTWAIRHGMARNGPALGWGEPERRLAVPTNVTRRR